MDLIKNVYLFERVYCKVIKERLEEPRTFIQIVTDTRGLTLFREQFKPHAAFVVGYEGYPATDFLTADLRTLFD
ncbi:MAG: hypothetical protein J6X88_08065 [Bacteroidales bacterium]|nr:hypothetical protein [Bacteroidales bacterium]